MVFKGLRNSEAENQPERCLQIYISYAGFRCCNTSEPEAGIYPAIPRRCKNSTPKTTPGARASLYFCCSVGWHTTIVPETRTAVLSVRQVSRNEKNKRKIEKRCACGGRESQQRRHTETALYVHRPRWG
ncbi:unnamed protein product [Ectocarpus sp. 12 AP-2014]